MIDLHMLRDDPKKIKDSLKKRNFPLKKFHQLRSLDKQWRKLLDREKALRHKRNVTSKKIAKMKKEGKSIKSNVKEMKTISEKIKNLSFQTRLKKEKMDELLFQIPNVVHKSVPKGSDESDNKTVRKWRKKKTFKFKAKDHIKLAKDLDLIDMKRAAKVSGARFYYLKGKLALLDMSLARYALDFLVDEGLTPMITPELARSKAFVGTGWLPVSEEDIYSIKGEDLNLIGTSEVTLASYHMDEVLKGEDLPLHYAGFSKCYRTEAGSHGRDTKGIFRTHEFNKIEFFSFCRPEKSWDEMDYMMSVVEKIWKKLRIPYRVVNVCSGELGASAAKKLDIEAWLPGQNKYREVVSCSNCLDYQSRRLKIRYKDKTNQPTKYVHTLNSTAVAVERALIALMENYQRKNGSIKIPKALWKYTGFKRIK